MTLRQYANLDVDGVWSLVISDKWGERIEAGVSAEFSALTQQLVDRLNVLATRYAETVGDLDAEIEALSTKVLEHLADMGVKRW